VPLRALRSLLAAGGALALSALGAPGAHAAGVTTHAFMAEAAIPYVADTRLYDLLNAHRDEVLSGAHYPDGGYGASSFPGGNYGEVSHWERFVNAYVAQLRDREDCPDLSDPSGPCADEVAHLLGTAAHGMGDEMWDWLFEPRMADLGEAPGQPHVPGLPGYAELTQLPGLDHTRTPEFSMDMIALVEHDRLARVPRYPPPVPDLLGAYARVGRTDVTAPGIAAGHGVITGAAAAERAAVPTEYQRVKATMPRSAATYLTDSGGVLDTAQAIAGYYASVWRKLTTDRHPPPRVIAVHPEPNEEDVTTDFQPERSGPGPRGGGAEQRILAVLSSSLKEEPISPDAFVLREEDGHRVALADGFPRPGPYGFGEGTHSMLIYPAADLEPCTRYTAEVSQAIRDHAGATLRDRVAWSFVTRPPAEGDECPRRAEDEPDEEPDDPDTTPGAGPAPSDEGADAEPEGTSPPATAPPAATAGPERVEASVSVHGGHAHLAPLAASVSLRGLRLSGHRRAAVVRVSCLGPGDCAGRLTLADARSRRTAGSAAFAIPRSRTHAVAVRLRGATRRRLMRRGVLRLDARARTWTARGPGATTQRRFTLRRR